MADKINKGRHCRTYISKVTLDQLKTIRQGDLPSKELAEKFNITVQYVNQIKRRTRKYYIK